MCSSDLENKDTAAVTLTISYNNNSTLRTIAKVTLQVGDTWTTDGSYDTNGNLKSVAGTVPVANIVNGTQGQVLIAGASAPAWGSIAGGTF